MSNEPLIRTKDLSKIYRADGVSTPALNGVDLDLHRSEFTAVAGPSGSGKSTLLTVRPKARSTSRARRCPTSPRTGSRGFA
jgi:ABC-type lipoprotein export system ATPase subunit